MQFTPAQAEEALRGANERQDYAEMMGFENYGGRMFTREEERLHHEVGALGEYAAANCLGLKFDPTVGRIDAVDLGIVEVRARTVGRLTDLAIRSGKDEEKLRLPFFLTVVNRPTLTVDLVGWLCGWEAWERRNQQNYHYGVWYIPPPYHSVLSLQQWVLCGHRRHWAPPKYGGEFWGGGF
jgi:hypothetical protein